MKTNLIIGILMFTALFSCNKNTNFHVKIINPANNTPYTNTKFFIRSESGNLFGETVLKTEKEGVTNENGEAIVALNVKGNKSYYVTIEALPNICYINDIRKYYNDRTDKNPEFVFEIAPCGQIKVNIQNMNCEGPTDLLNFKNRYNYTQWESGWSTDRLGCYTWESPEYFNVPAGWRIYRWRVIRPSGTVIYEDSIFLNAGQNHTFEMFY